MAPDAARPDAHPFVELRDVEKRFGDHVVLKGINLDVTEHEVALPHRRVGLGQVDVAAVHQRPRADPAGRGAGRRPARDPARRRAQPAARARRHRLPVLQPLPAHDRARERHARAAQGAEDLEGRSARRAPSRCSTASACGTSATRTPTSSPVVSSSGSRSCARWRCSRSSCCSTRSPPRSTPSSSPRCSRSSASSPRAA